MKYNIISLLLISNSASALAYDVDIYDSVSQKDHSVVIVTLDNGKMCKVMVKNSEIAKAEDMIMVCVNELENK